MKRNLFMLTALLAPFSLAHALALTPNNAVGSLVADVINAGPTTTVAPTAAGVRVTNAGQVIANAAGRSVTVPVSVAADVAKASVARAAAKAAVKAIPVISTIATIAEIANLLRDQGYQTDPSGNLAQQEQPGITGDPAGTGYRYSAGNNFTAKTPQAACDLAAAIWLGSSTQWALVSATVDASFRCTTTFYRASQGDYFSPYNTTAVGKISNWYTPALTNSLSSESVKQAILNKLNGDPTGTLTQEVYTQVRQDERAAQAQGQTWPDDYNPVETGTVVTVTAPPVSTPETVLKTETTTLPDSSTQTATTKQKITVTPTTTGTTVGDSTTTLPSQTITTVTTVNNTTNQTTTNQTVINNGAPDATQTDPTDPCTNNPTRLGCMSLDAPPNAETIPNQPVSATYTPIPFASSASCPSPVTFNLGRFGGQKSISWQPFCDTLAPIRLIFLACAAAACAWIFADGVSKL